MSLDEIGDEISNLHTINSRNRRNEAIACDIQPINPKQDLIDAKKIKA